MCVGEFAKVKGTDVRYARRDNGGWKDDEDIAGGRMLAVHPERDD